MYMYFLINVHVHVPLALKLNCTWNSIVYGIHVHTCTCIDKHYKAENSEKVAF